MDKAEEIQAKKELRSALESVLGPQLTGVTGYGVGLDRETQQVGLNVMVDGRLGDRLRRLRRSLPGMIHGLPVRISLAGLARLDR